MMQEIMIVMTLDDSNKCQEYVYSGGGSDRQETNEEELELLPSHTPAATEPLPTALLHAPRTSIMHLLRMW